jgi:transposase
MDTEILHSHCAGLDVHKKTVVACRVSRDDAGCRVQETRTFATMTNDLREMAAWLVEGSATHVAMESTGSYWRPVYNVLEGSFELIVVNPQHVRNLVGRKTDVKDAELIAKLLEHGLLRGSFIPAPEQRDLRDLTRERDNLVRERATVANRIQRVLEAANIKLASVATDVLGASGRAMLRSIVEGEEDPEVLARCARGRLREKDSDLREALTGRLRPQHLIVLTVLLRQVDSLDAGIATLSEAIEEFERPFEEAVQLVDTIPGVAKRLSQTIVSEIGDDMSRPKCCAPGGVGRGGSGEQRKRRASFVRQNAQGLSSFAKGSCASGSLGGPPTQYVPVRSVSSPRPATRQQARHCCGGAFDHCGRLLHLATAYTLPRTRCQLLLSAEQRRQVASPRPRGDQTRYGRDTSSTNGTRLRDRIFRTDTEETMKDGR